MAWIAWGGGLVSNHWIAYIDERLSFAGQLSTSDERTMDCAAAGRRIRATEGPLIGGLLVRSHMTIDEE